MAEFRSSYPILKLAIKGGSILQFLPSSDGTGTGCYITDDPVEVAALWDVARIDRTVWPISPRYRIVHEEE